jgi:hypothetical protein
VRAALGVVVIAVVIAAALLTLALAGLVGAMVARKAVGDDRGESGRRWGAAGAVGGIVGGQLAAFIAFVGSAALGWSLEGFVLPPICWLVAAVCGAATCVATRGKADLPRVG